jgi:hypothetical protein
MTSVLDPFRFVPIAVAGWMNQRHLQMIDYLREENRVQREQLGAKRLRFNDDQRRRLAAKAKGLGRFLAHYHSERHHQGLGNRIISPEGCHLGNTGAVQRRQRLGGMLNYYYRAGA